MTSLKTCKFFTDGTSNQFEWMLGKYDQCLELKAHNKSNKPENVIKLDKWYQNELPKKIKSRGKDAHLVHEEIVQTIKWKLARGKFRPNLTNMVRMNTPRVVMQETKKAFRKIAKNQDIQSAINSLCTLKGVGPAMASAVLSAGAPELAPYMADECLLSMPDVESLDYTVNEYMNLVEFVKGVVDRLNADHGSNYWDPHKVELAVWSHYVANDLKPEILEDMPAPTKSATNGESSSSVGGENVTSTNGESMNGSNGSANADSTDSADVDMKKTEEENVVNGDSKDNNSSDDTPSNDTPDTNGSSQKTEETNGNSEKVNGKSSSNAEIPSSTDSESTNDSTMNNLEAEDTNTNDSMKENNSATSTTTTTTSTNTSTKRPLEEVEGGEATVVETSKDKESDEQQPAAKKAKPAEEAPEAAVAVPPPETTPAETAA